MDSLESLRKTFAGSKTSKQDFKKIYITKGQIKNSQLELF